MELIAYCTSIKCASKSHQFYKKIMSIKYVPKSCNNCPDCGSSLFWQRAKNKRTPESIKQDRIRNSLNGSICVD